MTQDERMMILQMVADGKITAAEAAELLRAVEPEKQTNNDFSGQGGGGSADSRTASGRPADFASGLGAMIDNILDQVSTAFHENVGPRFEFPSELTGEFTGDEIPLRLTTHNGRVEVYTWDQPNYRANLTVKVRAATEEEARRRAEGAYTVRTENGFELETKRPDHGGDLAVHVTLMVPQDKRYRLETRTGNGRVELTNLNSPNCSVVTGNGKVLCRGGQYDRLQLRSGNGALEVESTVADLEASTGNGSVTLRPVGGGRQVMRISTGNGTARVETHRLPSGTGYKVEAHTGMGSISVGVPDLIFDRNFRATGHKHVIARTANYDQAETTVTINARTGMGSVMID